MPITDDDFRRLPKPSRLERAAAAEVAAGAKPFGYPVAQRAAAAPVAPRPYRPSRLERAAKAEVAAGARPFGYPVRLQRPPDAMTGAARKAPAATGVPKSPADTFAYPPVSGVVAGARRELTDLMERDFGPTEPESRLASDTAMSATVAPARQTAAPLAATPVSADAPGALSAVGLYRPTNAREPGDNARRAIGAGAALGKAGFDMAMKPGRAIRGAAADFGAGLLGIEDSAPPTTAAGGSAPTARAPVPLVEGDVGLESPEEMARIAAEQHAEAQRALAANEPRERVRQAKDDQGQAEDFVRKNAAPRSDVLNINRPMPIPGSDMQYAGQYGDTAVIERTGRFGERSFSDTDSVAGANRGPTTLARPNTTYDPAAEAQRIAQARAEYKANTTMEDGTRAFGGSSSERLHQARLDALARGDREGVKRSLMTEAERDMYDRQNAAYGRDPVKAYEIDRAAEVDRGAAASKSLSDQRNALLQEMGLDIRQRSADASTDRASTARETAMTKTVGTIAKDAFPDDAFDAPARSVLAAILAQAARSRKGADLQQIAALEAPKLRAAMAREGFDPGAYLADYLASGTAQGFDFSAADDVVPAL